MAPMHLAIVGSTRLKQHPVVDQIIRKVIQHYQPTLIISGGAKGVDQHAVAIAKELGIDTHEFLPDVQKWDGGEKIGFKQRNLLIAKTCDRLVRIAYKDSQTYGSGWTRDRAAELGKPTEEYIV